MRRVVVTGMGIVSPIGNDVEEVAGSLREARSGISFAPEYQELGFRSQVHGKPSLDPSTVLDRRALRFHGGGTATGNFQVAGVQAGGGTGRLLRRTSADANNPLYKTHRRRPYLD